METRARARRNVLTAIATIVVVANVVLAADQENQQTPGKPQAPKGVVIRGCLTGSTLTHLDPQNLKPDALEKIPDRLKVTSIRVIRDQVKALNGHEVEVTGALRDVPGLEKGILVLDSDSGKFYLGGGDARLGQDLVVSSNRPPTIHAQMIKSVADTCAGQRK